MADPPAYSYPYPRPALTVDLVILRIVNAEKRVLLIKRKHPPFKDHWALPGGFVDEGETLEQAAFRELKEETNITAISISQIGAFAAPGRDPRGWTISVAFAGNYTNSAKPIAGDDAAEVVWWATSELPPLAFDHCEIIDIALSRLAN